ncbi:hypothetical protein CPT_Merlin109 [Citrobacter phage Merlin]|uniref:Uncharacterized protein n=1 Tax=Citrobacter phage Merlin TaxID=1675602 RepID=A0A0K1LNM2_9CAUD|nr:hypothetical protein CPT_Merlin109 [Citrobacter phage Merlin]AKU43755.1 hypothetical protein CPT_Merlin109 [Citrobacter phage Merlin]
MNEENKIKLLDLIEKLRQADLAYVARYEGSGTAIPQYKAMQAAQKEMFDFIQSL